MPREHMPSVVRHGHIRIYAANDPAWVLLDQDNVICDSSRGAYARFAADLNEPCWAFWGLAVGAGKAEWANSSPTTPPPAPDPANTPTTLWNLLKRKPLMSPNGVRFFNDDGSISLAPTRNVQFRTMLNSDTDAISVPLMEMGLIGGGTRSANNGAGTDPLIAPFWDPMTNNPDSMVLMNYTTFGALSLPAVDLIFEWELFF